MPTLRIKPGVVRGASDASVPGRWHATSLVRWQNGVMEPIKGWQRITPAPLNTTPRNAHVWFDLNGARHMGVIGDDAVHREQNGLYYNITPDGFLSAIGSASKNYGSGLYGQNDYGSDEEPRDDDMGQDQGNDTGVLTPNWFSMDNWGEDLMFSSSQDGRVFSWSPSSSGDAPAVIPGAPALVQGFLITDERHMMVFGSAGTPNRVAWSDQEDRGGWDFTRVEGQAGYQDLEGAGAVFSAVKIPAGVLIFTTTSVWLCRYIGRPYYYGFEKLSEGGVPISAHSIAVAGSRAFWMSEQSFWVYQGGVVEPMPTTLGGLPFSDIATEVAANRVAAGYNGRYSEIWFFYPCRDTEREGDDAIENSRYLIYNFEEQWWANGKLDRTFYIPSYIDRAPLGADRAGNLYEHETGYYRPGIGIKQASRPQDVWAEASGLSFGDGNTLVQVNQAQPDNPTGPDAIEFDIDVKYVRGGKEYPAHRKLRPRQDGYLDLHFTAMDFSMTVRGVKDEPWALGAIAVNKVAKRGPR